MLCVLILYIFMILPKFSRKKKFEAFENLFYAHRGLHNDLYPENTLGAFERAKNMGFGIELDVQLTKDNVPIISHDFSLLRSCDVDKKIEDCTYHELQAYQIFNSQAHFCRLEEVLELIDHEVPLIIEIKQKGFNNQPCKIVANLLDDYQDNFVVESFNAFAMNWFLRNRPQWLRGQLSSNFMEDSQYPKILRFMMTHLCLNFLSRPDFIAYDIKYYHEFSFRLLKRFTKTVGWTFKDEKIYDQLKNEFDFIIFEKFIPK